MKIFVYVLHSLKTDRIYVGMTNNLDRRMKEHNQGQNRSTKAYVPWSKIYHEEYASRPEARKREKYLKTYRGREWIRNNLINQHN